MSRISKLLSLVLRHDPARIGITLDEAGWVDVDVLLAALGRNGTRLTREQLDEIVATSDKQRFAYSADGARIRANQGHSIPVALGLPAVPPPETLYHGTVDAALPGIRAQGLVKGARHDVHLSADLDTAMKVGGRRGKPVILVIQAGAMADAGHVFHRSENGVWLTSHVPPHFIVFDDARASNVSRKRSSIAASTIAACDAGEYTNEAGEVVPLRDAIAAAKAGTVLYELGRDAFTPWPRRDAMAIEVTAESTLEALVRLDRAWPHGHVACLNFASAKNPGGGFLRGAQAQEESLARSSALYPCLVTQPEHYARNRAHGSALYLDLAIYSPRVPFFRSDRGAWLERPVLASVITCAAPNASALRQQHRIDEPGMTERLERTLRARAHFVLAIAAHHRVDHLVLGAWGAGVFGNDPALVARAFAHHLEGDFARAFASVVFAIYGGEGPNHDAFVAAFGGTTRPT